jgi:hypothetical protein
MIQIAAKPLLRLRQIDQLVLAAAALLCGCHSLDFPRKPVVEITRAPAASPGGPELLDRIEGRVSGSKPGEQIVLYAHAGAWWIQPFANQVFTKIQPDGTWKNATHLGTEYAALLVESGYQPPAKIAVLPKEGNGVEAIVTAQGKPGAPILQKVIHFSGYDWNVRSAGSDRGGEPNAYDPGNAWTDNRGYLHLRMSAQNGKWSCAEINLTRSLGYGTYRFVVQDSSHLGPSAVLGMYTWDEVSSANFRNELDIELSRWGNPGSKNAQYVVQPFFVPENVIRFMIPPGVFTHSFRWEPGRVSFQSTRGSAPGTSTRPVGEHVFTSGVPAAGSETVHIVLYDFHHSRRSEQQPAEVVLEKFEYLP